MRPGYGQRVALAYPDPGLTDGVVRLRRWSEDDLECVRQAATDARIPAGTTVPLLFSEAAGREFIRRQWGRAESGEGLSLAIADATGAALGLTWLGVRADLLVFSRVASRP
jgi:hypothetical protein